MLNAVTALGRDVQESRQKRGYGHHSPVQGAPVRKIVIRYFVYITTNTCMGGNGLSRTLIYEGGVTV